MNNDMQSLERYDLTLQRIHRILEEKTVAEPYRDYFYRVADFLLQVEAVGKRLQNRSYQECTLEELEQENHGLYQDILGAQYEKSYANPTYAKEQLGEAYGPFLSALYTEMRGEIPYVYEGKTEYLAICNELFIEVYNAFEEEEQPESKTLHDIFYWYASDYCDVFVADRIVEQVDPKEDFAIRIIEESDLSDLRYLYQYGEFISENEKKTALHLQSLPKEVLARMAEVYTEGYRLGFVAAGIDLSKKETVNIHYPVGFERMMKLAIANFRAMGLEPTAYRVPVSVVTKRANRKSGYGSTSANKQYEYDHRFDNGLFLDKKFVERKLDVMKNAFEDVKELAGKHAGPAVVEVFGEVPFLPVQKEESIRLTEKQEKLSVLFQSKSGQLTNQYIKGEERSFTIIAYPLPEIGPQYEEIFNEIIRINTLDMQVYEKVQQTLIDALDQGEYVHILGKGANETDLKVQLYRLADPETETIFENCVADVNIPVGEVFTSPVLKGTNGTLHVSKVYLDELQYQDLKVVFEDGMVQDYSCRNFQEEEEGRKFIKHNVLFNHDTLPMGEFAIGTNTTAYVVAKKYGIEEKFPILIAEKMGPHFAVGDTCYSWSEEHRLYNKNGKEIVAKDNEISLLRKEDVAKAYFQCHTDITIPYEEIQEISVVCSDGKKICLLQDGRFVLPGAEVLNEPFDEM